MKRSKIAALLCVILAALIVTAVIIGNNTTKTVVMDSTMSYAGFDNYDDALSRATLVVYGTVEGIGSSFEVDFGYTVSSGEKIENPFYYTPITIKIDEVIKGNYNERDVVYNALGGKIGSTLYDYEAYDTLDFEVGDKILVYLRNTTNPEIGYECIGPQCAISEDESGKATKEALGGADADTLFEQVEAAKNVYSLMVEDEGVTE